MDSPKAFPFSNEELDAAGLVGEGVSTLVESMMKTMAEHPELLDLSLFTLECINYSGHRKSPSSPASPNPGKPSFLPAALAIASDAPPYVLSDWEKTMYYHGISPYPPDLLYRSDLLENPFPIPKGIFPHVPTKTVYGVFDTSLNPVWDIVAPKICEFLKALKIRYSAVMAARFLSHGEKKDTLGPVVVWIATRPTTTTAKDAHDASPGILALLKDNGVEGAVVEWYEGAVEKLSGPHLLRVVDDTDPTHYVRRFLTTALGMPIAPAQMEDADAQGSVAMFFHENKDKHGDTSAKVFGVSNCHVLRENTTVEYEFKGAGRAPAQHIQLAGFHRFQRGLDEIKGCICVNGINADLLAREIVEWEAKPKSEDLGEVAKDEAMVQAKRKKLAKVKKNIGVLEDFYKDVNSQWGDIARRNIGHVDWAPEISVDVQDRRYTKDIGTFELDAAKFKAQFKGNVVDLGSKFTHWQLTNMFYPESTGRTTFKFPWDRQFRINDCLTRELLAAPNCFDRNGNPCLIVMKDGNTTDLTVGRYAGLEAYICDDHGVESIELAIYNYDLKSGPFSAKGDSGSLVFDGEGHMVGIVHSGMQKGPHKHVTFATPAWWAIEQIKQRYPHADFNRTTF